MARKKRNLRMDWRRTLELAILIVLLPPMAEPLMLRAVAVPWTAVYLPLWQLVTFGLFVLELAFLLFVLLWVVTPVVKRTQSQRLSTSETTYRGDSCVVLLGWFVPRQYRNTLIGDILEDCAEMREDGCTERRIKFHAIYQWLIAVITIVPTAVKTSIIDAVRQVISPPK